jgi:dipeptidase D
MKSILLIAAVTVLSVATFAASIEEILQSDAKAEINLDWINQCNQSSSCDIFLFHELSKYSRPSGKELPLVLFIQSLYAVAKQNIWKYRPTQLTVDSFGNVVISLPSTGIFKSKGFRPVALQSHMDMVLAHAEAIPGENIESQFINGVKMEALGGWIQSKNRKTTLGADNGIGVAYALRYLINPKLAHPPLELIFTTKEEVGLKGAMALEIPLKSPYLLSLDGMTSKKGQLIVASQGAFGARLFKNALSGLQVTGLTAVRVTLSNLLGGHSGNDIFKQRLNAVKGFSQFFDLMKESHPEMKVANLIAGDPQFLNKIPNVFSVDLLLPISELNSELARTAFEAEVNTYIKTVVATFKEDATNAYAVNVEYHANSDQTILALTPDLLDAVIRGIIETPNGVQENNTDFPNSVQSSTNHSYITVQSTAGGTFDWSSGFFSRSYVNASLKIIKDLSLEILSKSVEAFAGSETEIKVQSTYDAWIAPKNSPLQKKLLSGGGYFKTTTMANVGLEPSAFMARYPNMDIVAISPIIESAHTINERIEIESLLQVSQEIQRLLSVWSLK